MGKSSSHRSDSHRSDSRSSRSGRRDDYRDNYGESRKSGRNSSSSSRRDGSSSSSSSGRRRSSRREEPSGKGSSCCCWAVIFLAVVSMIAAGILIWKFVPWDDAINNALDSVEIPGGIDDDNNENANSNNNAGGGGSTPGTSTGTTTTTGTTTPPVSAEKEKEEEEEQPPPYKFIQCDPAETTTDCCNGLDSVCDLRADEILYATLHNGMSTLEDGFLFGPNHKFGLEKALDAGYRGLNLDICNCGGEIIFCHGICTLGPRDVVDVMTNVNEFLDEHPSEIVVFIFQVNNDVDQTVDLNDFYDRLLQVDGLVDKMYVHGGNGDDNADDPWPTLRELTDPDYNKRILMFHYNGPNCNADPSACPDGLHLYYNHASDNDWSHDSIDSVFDRANSCPLRPNGINRKTFVGLNNFVSPPSQSSASVLNQYPSVTDYVAECSKTLRADINFVLVDFWSEGELPRYAQEHNAALALMRLPRR